MGWQDWLGINQLDQEFGYNPAMASGYQYETQGYDPAMAEYNTSADSRGFMNQLKDQSKFGFGQAKQFFDPSSDYYKQQRGFLSEDVAEGVGTLTRGQNQQLAQRGMGGGGLSNLLSSANRSSVGEQVRQGMRGMQATGLQAGTQLLGISGQAASAGGNLASQESQRGLQTSLANQSATNTASQFGANWANQANQDYSTQQYGASLANQNARNQQQQFWRSNQYQQDLGNRNVRGAFANSMIGLVGGFGSQYLGHMNKMNQIAAMGTGDYSYNPPYDGG